MLNFHKLSRKSLSCLGRIGNKDLKKNNQYKGYLWQRVYLFCGGALIIVSHNHYFMWQGLRLSKDLKSFPSWCHSAINNVSYRNKWGLQRLQTGNLLWRTQFGVHWAMTPVSKMKVQNTADWGNLKEVASRKSHNAIEEWLVIWRGAWRRKKSKRNSNY